MAGNRSRRKGSSAELELHAGELGPVAEQIGRYAIAVKRSAPQGSPATAAG